MWCILCLENIQTKLKDSNPLERVGHPSGLTTSNRKQNGKPHANLQFFLEL